MIPHHSLLLASVLWMSEMWPLFWDRDMTGNTVLFPSCMDKSLSALWSLNITHFTFPCVWNMACDWLPLFTDFVSLLLFRMFYWRAAKENALCHLRFSVSWWLCFNGVGVISAETLSEQAAFCFPAQKSMIISAGLDLHTCGLSSYNTKR